KRTQSISRRFTSHGVACLSLHVLSLVNHEAVTDQRCPSARINNTATKPAIATQGRRIVTLATGPKSQPAQPRQTPPPTAAKTQPKSDFCFDSLSGDDVSDFDLSRHSGGSGR